MLHHIHNSLNLSCLSSFLIIYNPGNGETWGWREPEQVPHNSAYQACNSVPRTEEHSEGTARLI